MQFQGLSQSWSIMSASKILRSCYVDLQTAAKKQCWLHEATSSQEPIMLAYLRFHALVSMTRNISIN
jgi:hypothetical protein